ncbi:MAG TPA: FAD-dependent oxidoreductase [Planctomycetota bacterium]|nr:FAD-dependent oxidoreductase [Planctomycetota bacterium]
MKVGVVGGGMLGLTLALRLGRSGHRVHLLEAEPQLGGLATWQDYGPFVWDRFYHCILPQDTSLLGLLEELGLAGELEWTRTGTGYYSDGQFHSMSNNRDFLKFPVLSLFDKARLAAAVVWATRFADPDALYGVSAEAWLTRLCGERAYTRFWQPLLKAKFGPFHDRVAAVFIYATLLRLFGARSAAAGKESLGYVRGGYRRIFSRLRDVLESGGASIRTGTSVLSVEPDGSGCRVRSRSQDGESRDETYDRVFFTAPTRLARKVVAPSFLPRVDEVERAHPTSTAYLGVACLVLVLDRPLTPYYVLNIGEPSIELTGLIEMTNLIDPATQTRGRSLVYLPRYMDSESSEFQESDASLRERMIERGVKRLFPDFDLGRALYAGIHRARYVQPLPLVREGALEAAAPAVSDAGPFSIINTSMLRCATLNNNEVVALVDRILPSFQASLSA